LTTSPELRRFAYDEWRDGYSRLSASDRQVAVVLANHWNWYDQAILTAAQQSFFSDYELLYPRPYDSYVKAAAEKSHLPVELIYATLRQESLYRIDAQSAAGAIGLMQLMPEPSRRTPARGSDSSGQIDPTKDPLNAATNISRGTAKLNSFREMFAGRVALALAAYNAGPGAVKRWLPPVNKDIDVWVENIPYNETRVYVQRVMWHSVVFGWLLSGKAQMTSGWLAEVKAGM
jgi:soluble lytic murein transglycosylase